MTPGWSPLEMTILVLSGHIPLEKFLKFNTLTISVTAKKKTCLVDLCPKWCYSSYVSPSISWDSLAIPLGTFGRCSLCASLHRVEIHGTKMSWDLWTRKSLCFLAALLDLLSNDEHPWWIFLAIFGWLSNDLFVFHLRFCFFSQCVSQIGLEFYRSCLFFVFLFITTGFITTKSHTCHLFLIFYACFRNLRG